MPLLTWPRFITAACRQTDRMYVHVHDQNDNTTYASTRWVPTVRHFLACKDVAGGSLQSGGRIIFFARNMDTLPCVQRCSWWVPTVRGKRFFTKQWLVQWVPAIKWRNNYFACNKEALPCCGHGPSCQPLHIQYPFDGSRTSTMLTTLRREH